MVVINTFKDVLDSLPLSEAFVLPALKPNSLEIEFNENEKIATTYSGLEPPWPFADSEVFHCNIIDWKRLTANQGDCKAVYEVTFNVEGSNFKFKAGDTIGVIPHNDESDVNFIISHLNLNFSSDLSYTLSIDKSVKGSKIPGHIPVKSTIRHVLTYCLDLRSVLKKLFLLALSQYTKDDKERKILEYFCSKEGSTAYTTHILNKNLCLLDIFTIFKTCKPPIQVLLNCLPRLLPRPYSIVNSGLKNNEILKICFSVMTINNRKGLTTGWIEKLITSDENLENQIRNLKISNEVEQQQKVSIYLRKNLNLFCLPENLETPLILIGPGTGVAPFLGFLEEREYLGTPKDAKLGKAWLFFGCRNSKLDFIYEEELKKNLSSGTLSRIFTAFSREDGSKKYIQDSLLENGKEVIQLIKNGALIYICGDLKTMVADIKEVFVKCLVEHDGITLEEGQKIITEMQKNKRLLVDAWS